MTVVPRGAASICLALEDSAVPEQVFVLQHSGVANVGWKELGMKLLEAGTLILRPGMTTAALPSLLPAW